MGKFRSSIINALTEFPVMRFLQMAMIVAAAITSAPKPLYAQAPKPDGPLAVILIRDALSALNHANWTGNYTVFRDYASPNFARNNNPARLSDIFRSIRSENLNLAPTLFIVPKITKAELTSQGKRLQLKGFFDSKPKQIHFDLIFEPVANRWRLFGISIRPVEPKIAEAKPVPILKIDEGVEEPKPPKPVAPTDAGIAKKPTSLPRIGVPKKRPDG